MSLFYPSVSRYFMSQANVRYKINSEMRVDTVDDDMVDHRYNIN